MIFKLIMNDIEYDITKIVDKDAVNKSIEMSFSTSGEFHTASLLIPSVKQYELSGIDLARPLLRNSLLIMEINNTILEWRIDSDVVENSLNGRYAHSLSLIEKKSELVGINVPNMMVTQPTLETFLGLETSKLNIDMSEPLGNENYAVDFPGKKEWFQGPRDNVYVSETYEWIKPSSFGTMINYYKVKLDPYDSSSKVQRRVYGKNPKLDLFSGSIESTNISGNILKTPDMEYNIYFNMNLINPNLLYGGMVRMRRGDSPGHWNEKMYRMRGADMAVRIRLVINGREVKEWNEQLMANRAEILFDRQTAARMNGFTGTALRKEVSGFYKYIPSEANEVVEMFMDIIPILGTGQHVISTENKDGSGYIVSQSIPLTLNVDNFELKITTKEMGLNDAFRLDQFVDKVLLGTYLNEVPLYTINPSSRARLAQIESPEFNIINQNMFGVLDEVANFLGVTWSLIGSEITFNFIDDNIIIPEYEEIQFNSAENSSDGYISSYQLNTANMLNDNVIDQSWTTLRSTDERVSQITTDNIMIRTNQSIQRIKSVHVKGVHLEDSSGTTILDINDEIDMTDRVIPLERWDILPGYFDKSTDGRIKMLKNNYWYFEPGSQGIKGLSYNGSGKPGFIVDGKISRSIFEAVAAQLYEKTSLIADNMDTGSKLDDSFQMRIEYYPIVDATLNIYKEDLSGFQIERTAYFNQQAQLVDQRLMGKTAQNLVNRSGGTEYFMSGDLTNLSILEDLGYMRADGKRLTDLSISMNRKVITYLATFVQDFLKTSTYITKRNDQRIWEIPRNEITFYNMKERLQIEIGSAIPFSASNRYERFLKTFENEKVRGPDIGKLEFIHNASIDNPEGKSTVYTLPIKYNMGRSASWKFQSSNAENFGLYRTSHLIEGEKDPVRFQEEAGFTDYFGNVREFSLELYEEYNKTASVEKQNMFPKEADVKNNINLSSHYPYRKDAREAFSFEKEFIFVSSDISKYKIYDGITKFNSFITGNEDYNVEVGVLTTLPYPSADVLQSAHLNPSAGIPSVDVNNERIRIMTTNGEGIGIAFYEKDTMELLFVYRDEIEANSTYTIPYGIAIPKGGLIPIYVIPNDEDEGYNDNYMIYVKSGEPLELPPLVEWPMHQFLGWYRDKELTEYIALGTPVYEAMTLYGKWERIQANLRHRLRYNPQILSHVEEGQNIYSTVEVIIADAYITAWQNYLYGKTKYSSSIISHDEPGQNIDASVKISLSDIYHTAWQNYISAKTRYASSITSHDELGQNINARVEINITDLYMQAWQNYLYGKTKYPSFIVSHNELGQNINATSDISISDLYMTAWQNHIEASALYNVQITAYNEEGQNIHARVNVGLNDYEYMKTENHFELKTKYDSQIKSHIENGQSIHTIVNIGLNDYKHFKMENHFKLKSKYTPKITAYQETGQLISANVDVGINYRYIKMENHFRLRAMSSSAFTAYNEPGQNITAGLPVGISRFNHSYTMPVPPPRPTVTVTYRTYSSTVYFDTSIRNNGDKAARVYYKVNSSSYVDGGLVGANMILNVNNVYTSTTSSTRTVYVYAYLVYVENGLAGDSNYGYVTYRPAGNLTWQYNGRSSAPFCAAPGYSQIGTSCSVDGQTQTVSGASEGYSSDCIELICR